MFSASPAERRDKASYSPSFYGSAAENAQRCDNAKAPPGPEAGGVRGREEERSAALRVAHDHDLFGHQAAAQVPHLQLDLVAALQVLGLVAAPLVLDGRLGVIVHQHDARPA